MTLAADCGNVPPTLNVQMDTVHDGSLTLGDNTVHSSPKKLFRLDFSGSDLWPQPSSWFDYPGLTHTPILLVHYQIAFGMGANDDKSQNYLK